MTAIRDIYREIHPVFLVSKFLGLAPYTYGINFSEVFGLITLVFILATLGATGAMTVAPFGDDSAFALILNRAQTLLLGLTTITALVMSLLNTKTLDNLCQNFVKIDTDLKSIGVFVSHSWRFGVIAIFVRCLILFPVLFLDLYSSFKINRFTILKEFVDLASQLATFITEVQFMTLANSIKTRVATMTKTVSAFASKLYPGKPKKLTVLSTCHSTLAEMASTINDLFTIQMLMIMFTIFLMTTAHLYELILDIVAKTRPQFVEMLAVTLKACLRSFEIWTITTVCVNLQEHMKEFNNVLYQVLIEDESGVLAENKKLQLHVAMKKEVAFTAYNFFSIDYTLVHSMISAATTYLVILVQFSPTESSPEAAPTASTIDVTTEYPTL